MNVCWENARYMRQQNDQKYHTNAIWKIPIENISLIINLFNEY